MLVDDDEDDIDGDHDSEDLQRACEEQGQCVVERKENFGFLVRVDSLFSGEEQGGFGEDDGQQRLDEEQLQLCHCHDHVL